ncbi:MAG: aldolase [Roseobacter sp.]
MGNDGQITRLHASCVDIGGKGVLIVGASGTGKSSLALQLLGLGALLVSDDWTEISLEGKEVLARPPATIMGLVEARGVGILRACALAYSRIVLVIDMDQDETDRLPQEHFFDVCGVPLTCLYKTSEPHFPAAIVQFLKAGRRDPS